MRDRPLRKLLTKLGDHGWTGAVACSAAGNPETADVYLYEGGIYAVHVPWYRPHVRARLISAGVLDRTRDAIVARSLGPDPDDLSVGRFAVGQEWLSVDSLGAIHSEFLLAALGSFVGGSATGEREGSSTDEFCTLPAAVPAVLESLAVRGDRERHSWTQPFPADVAVVRRSGALSQVGNRVPEVRAFLREMDAFAAGSQGVSLADIARQCGFTRAEASFLAARLADEGVCELLPGARADLGAWPEGSSDVD